MLETTIYAVIISFFIGVILCPVLIPMLHRLKFGQNVRDDGPESHLKKTGTPTMGGIAILIAFAVTSVVFSKGNSDAIAVILVTLCFGAVGFIDDYIKIVKKRSLGLRAWQKIVLQLVITGVFCAYVVSNVSGYSNIIVPFLNRTVNLGVIYIPFLFVVVLGTVNGVNLTDGLDGLSSGVTVLVAAFFAVMALVMSSGISPVAGAVVGALLAFLIFNSYPAKVFMGDTGSLALGGFVASTALILKMPIFIVIVGFIYFIESLSVIIQVGSFKLFHKRVFKMAPIHHHFELCGWNETKVVMVFYIVTAMLCLVAFLSLKTFIF
ncbi:MAG: phospho-N-acetylmuramoyl-pentapeptide-transferase [Lachnospiraceae bacterium]|nr:phospho-N-acetylmuramoyl-pentapeptide-transferase [Lachnospiraceae bacterium]